MQLTSLAALIPLATSFISAAMAVSLPADDRLTKRGGAGHTCAAWGLLHIDNTVQLEALCEREEGSRVFVLAYIALDSCVGYHNGSYVCRAK